MIHVQGRLLYNCCKAYPERVNLDWLEANPGRLFHTDTMLEDRRLMLDNKSCVSCHHGCYKYEEQRLTSTRQKYINDTKISDPHAPIRHLDISLSTDCNLTCMYCSPEWSSSWQKDIEKNGDYLLDGVPVKQNDNWSNLWAKMKQKSRGIESRFFAQILREIKLSTGLQSVSILGGEPLLNNQLDQMLDYVHGKKITITTHTQVSSPSSSRTTTTPLHSIVRGSNRKEQFRNCSYLAEVGIACTTTAHPIHVYPLAAVGDGIPTLDRLTPSKHPPIPRLGISRFLLRVWMLGWRESVMPSPKTLLRGKHELDVQ